MTDHSFDTNWLCAFVYAERPRGAEGFFDGNNSRFGPVLPTMVETIIFQHVQFTSGCDLMQAVYKLKDGKFAYLRANNMGRWDIGSSGKCFLHDNLQDLVLKGIETEDREVIRDLLPDHLVSLHILSKGEHE